MVGQAIGLGLKAIGIADRNTVAGVVRAYVALNEAPDKARAALLDIKKDRGEALELTPQEAAYCQTNLRLIVGARLVFVDGTPDIIAYPASRKGWGRLTRLLTLGNMQAVKGDCILTFDDLLAYLDDLLLIVLPVSTAGLERAHKNAPDYAFEDDDLVATRGHLSLVPPAAPTGLEEVLARLSACAPGCVWLGVTTAYSGGDARRLAHMQAMARRVGIPLLATNDALYAEPANRPLHDVLTCLREGTTIMEAGRRLEANAERYLKPPDEMARLFRKVPEAIAETVRFIARIDFTLDALSYEYPHEPVPDGWEPQAWLEKLTWDAGHERYPDGLPDKLVNTLNEELGFIRDQNYAYYFLTVHDLVRFAREQKPPILCQGRGSAANSAVCFLLGVTSVDPMQFDLLFSRFVSADRKEPPDIDVDFEHERREEVMQYVYRRYGRHRAGIAATVIHFRSRSAVREVAKVLGLSEDIPVRMAGTVWGSHSGDMDRRIAEAGFDLANPQIVRLRELVRQLVEAPFPRHLSQHVGGFVLTQDRLDETVPIHNGAMKDRSFIEWDKDDIDALGLMKVDVLALGMLTCIRKAYEIMRANGLGDYDLTVDIDSSDPLVYDMLCEGDSVGVFQVESRAQINMLPRLRPRALYDLTIQVAIVRPGPIEGNMVHPYLRRRSGEEDVQYPAPFPEHGPKDELVDVLGKTKGVPLFQEQAMRLAIVAAKFSDCEANQLRRAMATFRNLGTIHQFRDKLVNGMTARGYEPDFAERCYKQIEGFGSYGFPESHALSFARLVYVSAWIKCHHPAVFACALLNSQPMGFYAPAQIVRDAREHGVAVRRIDVNHSAWDNGVERVDAPAHAHAERKSGTAYSWNKGVQRQDSAFALRLGFRQVDGFREEWAYRLVEARAAAPFTSIEDLARRALLPTRALRLLADADACRSLGQDRRDALWEVRRTPTDELPLFAAAKARELGAEPDAALPAMALSEHVAADYQTARLSLKGHPMQFLRPLFQAEAVLSCAEVCAAKNGARVQIAGIVLVRQRPGKGNAIFITLEDETGIANILLWARLFEMQRRPVMTSRLMMVEGEVQRSKEGVVHLMATRVINRTDELDRLSETHRAQVDLLRADVFEHPIHPRTSGHPRNVRILPKSRDFH